MRHVLGHQIGLGWAAATVVVWAVWSDRIKRRAPFVLCGQLLCLTGFVVNVAAESIGARYFGTFLVVSGGYAAYPAMVAWCVFFLYIPGPSSPRRLV